MEYTALPREVDLVLGNQNPANSLNDILELSPITESTKDHKATIQTQCPIPGREKPTIGIVRNA